MGSEKPDLGSGRPALGSERPDLGSGRPDLRSEKPDLGSERSDLESKRPDLGSERLYLRLGGDGRMETGENCPMWNHRSLAPLVDLDSKIFLGQSVAQSFAWTCSALSIMHVSNFKVLAQIL